MAQTAHKDDKRMTQRRQTGAKESPKEQNGAKDTE